MAIRVPEEELARLKREVSIERLVTASGIELKKHGSNLVGRCPWHDDKTPSLVVTPEKGLWHCMGACNVGGSVIDWVMRSQCVSFRHAVELLRTDSPAAMAPVKLLATRSRTAKLEPLFSGNESDDELLEGVAHYYHERLLLSPPALEYLEKRGLRDDGLIKGFQIGFADRSLGYRLPPRVTKAGAFVRRRLDELGIFRESGHEHFRGCIVVGIRDRKGKLVQLYGRRSTPSPRSNLPKHLYLSRPLAGVFNFEGIAGQESIILCESVLDAMTFHVAGFHNVTCAPGVNGMSLEIMEALSKTGARRVFIAYDSDDAGEKGVRDLVEGNLLEGFEAYRVLFPRGMDANEYAMKVQPAARSLQVALEKAKWLGLVGGARSPAGYPMPLMTRPEVKPAAPATSQSGAPQASAATTTTTTPPHSSATRAPAKASTLAAASEKREEPLPLVVEPVPLPTMSADEETDAAATAPPSLAQTRGDELRITLGDRRFRIRGLERNTSYDLLKVNLLVEKGDAFFVDTLDLYSAKHRASFIRDAAAELQVDDKVLKKDLGKVLLLLEQMQEKRLTEELEPKSATPELTPDERERALELLRDPRLTERILEDFEKTGVVGERVNKLTGYLAAISRKLDHPLAVIIQSSSAAGKSSLMDAVLSFVPDEDRVKYSAMTGQSLFYMGETDLAHKILAIVEEEGAERAAYALKLLQSEGELTIASTGKDPQSGRLVTQEYRVCGPVMIFLTTTAIEIDEELLNRCLVLTVDEEREQTRAIHKLQRRRETLEGILEQQDKGRVLALHKNAQRLLAPLLVANPFAEKLTFLDDKTRTRRDHMKYLTLIRAIALLHQHQRPRKSVMHEGDVVEYIEVAERDIAIANRLCHEVLGRTLDELPPQTRRLLMMLDEMVGAECARLAMDRSDYRFTRKQVREHTGWSEIQVRVRMTKLVDLEHVAVHRGGRGQSFVYELVYDGQGKDGRPFLPGLLDVQGAALTYDQNFEHRRADFEHRSGDLEHASSSHRGTFERPSRSAEIAKKLNGHASLAVVKPNIDENALLGRASAAGGNGVVAQAAGAQAASARPRGR